MTRTELRQIIRNTNRDIAPTGLVTEEDREQCAAVEAGMVLVQGMTRASMQLGDLRQREMVMASDLHSALKRCLSEIS